MWPAVLGEGWGLISAVDTCVNSNTQTESAPHSCACIRKRKQTNVFTGTYKYTTIVLSNVITSKKKKNSYIVCIEPFWKRQVTGAFTGACSSLVSSPVSMSDAYLGNKAHVSHYYRSHLWTAKRMAAGLISPH